jgi:hypothetical protein
LKRLLKSIILISLVVSFVISLCSSCSLTEKKTTNLEWKNTGNEEGDADGPAYVVYSKKGYNMASEIIDLSSIQSNLVRRTDKETVNSYLFLGADIYDKSGQWENCADAGLCLSGAGKWHAFVNRYECDDDNWFESDVNLDSTHKYKLVLDCSQKDEYFTLSIYDVANANKKVDSKTCNLYYSKKDGSNISLYQDYAIDFPDDVKMDTTGQYSGDWEKVVAYNTNQNLYMRNITVSDACLYKSSAAYKWESGLTNDRFMWPEKSNNIKYACTTIRSVKQDVSCIIDLDLNNASK